MRTTTPEKRLSEKKKGAKRDFGPMGWRVGGLFALPQCSRPLSLHRKRKRRVDFCVLVGCARALRNIAPRLRSTFRPTPSSCGPFFVFFFQRLFFGGGFAAAYSFAGAIFGGVFVEFIPPTSSIEILCTPYFFFYSSVYSSGTKCRERLLFHWPSFIIRDSPFTCTLFGAHSKREF